MRTREKKGLPDRRAITFSAIRRHPLADGKIIANWAVQDALGLLGQLKTA
jgi:predicted ester cyclase